MAAKADTVLYHTPETNGQPSIAVVAIVTALKPEGDVLFLMGEFTLGFVQAQLAPEPTPGFYTEIAP